MKKQTYQAVHLLDSTRAVEGTPLHRVVASLAIDSQMDMARPVEVEMTPWQARRWAASLTAMAEKAEKATHQSLVDSPGYDRAHDCVFGPKCPFLDREKAEAHSLGLKVEEYRAEQARRGDAHTCVFGDNCPYH